MPIQTPLAPAVPAAAPTGKQRALLALVITLGVLMLLGFAVLVGGLVMGVGGGGRSESAKPWSYSLDVPAGTHIAVATVNGNRVLVHLVSRDGEDVVLIDAGSGKIIGRIQVKSPR